jgi:hypothetical protein
MSYKEKYIKYKYKNEKLTSEINELILNIKNINDTPIIVNNLLLNENKYDLKKNSFDDNFKNKVNNNMILSTNIIKDVVNNIVEKIINSQSTENFNNIDNSITYNNNLDFKKNLLLDTEKNDSMKKNFLALIVRCKNEPYVSEFVNYYINQGVDYIYIVDDNSNKEIYKDVINNKNVNIIYQKNIINSNYTNILYNNIKNLYEWIIYVDMDEYITTKKNINNTIRKELETTFKDCMCVKIPWVIMSCNSIKNNPDSLLHTNIYRWNHDNKHINNKSSEYKFRCRYNSIEVKCIFKPKYFKNIFDHHPINPITNNIKIVESINNTYQQLDCYYNNLREINIMEGYLLCYHYRIISIQNCLDKIKYNIWYKKYTLQDLLSTDYPEIIDETLKNKI